MLTALLDRLTGHVRVRVNPDERVIALIEGRFVGVLGPGEHRLRDPRRTLELDRHAIGTGMGAELLSRFARPLERERPDLAAEHLAVLAGREDEAAVLFRDGAPFAVSRGPHERRYFWVAAGPWEVRRAPLGEVPRVDPDLARALERTGIAAPFLTRAVVEAWQTGLLFVAGTFHGTLAPGAHLFWQVGRRIEVRVIDTRAQTHEVAGQEVLTKDRVTVRVNLTAQYRVTDPVLAASSVKDFVAALHGAVQLAFRRTIGERTVDSLLADKVSVDAEAADKVRREMAAIGVEVGEIALKDVILPGEMREILNRVVAAEKEAEANVIRRREETAATRSLLNTAKLMAENPVMLRLKELEALGEIAGKVERLTVHNGTQGLLSDVVRLSE
ncbi:MAG: slipin family protein [Paracoccaceae bacterium]